MRRRFPRLSLLVTFVLIAGYSLERAAVGDPAATVAADAGARHSLSPFDPAVATRAYLDKVPADKKARSDAYFEGGYLLLVASFAVTAVVQLMLLMGGGSARLRDLVERVGRWRPLHTFLYWAGYVVLTTLMTFPLTVYEGYFREHAYGLANQGFGGWLGDELKGVAIGILLGGILVVVLVSLVRLLPRTWWIWGAGVCVAFLAVVMLAAPVYLAPLFNKYSKLADARVRDPILRLARANGIPVDEVYEVDASRQSTRVSANVSGFLGTERVTLNDNLLRRCSLPEIEAVMGHEMGHYVLNHVYKGLLFMGVVAVLFFAFLRWAIAHALRRFGRRWRVHGIDDLAVLPLVMLLASFFFFAMTPVLNTETRTAEMEADMFGLNASRQPDGMAEVALKLGDYRKLDPGPVEEWIFFDHPSGRRRIAAAMAWKAQHLDDCGR